MKKITILFLILCLNISCKNNNIGDKVYIEIWRNSMKLHIDRNCHDINKNHMVEYVNVTDLYKKYKIYSVIPFCTNCVSDDDADKLSELCYRKTFLKKHKAKGQDRRDILYKNLRDAGIGEDLIGTQQDFKDFVSNERNARDVYKNLRDEGISEHLIGTEDEFYKFIAPDFEVKEDNIKALYNELKNEYDLGTEDQFRTSLKKQQNRHNLYNALKEEYDVGTFDEFEEKLGY